MIRPSRPATIAEIASHYDELDPFYREIWGEHVHHGYWRTGRESPQEAVEALVDLLAEHLELRPGLRVCDIGCGYGAAGERLAERHGVEVTGVTVSSEQGRRAQARRPRSGSLQVLCQDWLANPFPDAAFDRAFSIESSEHIGDKERFFAEVARVLRPGGRFAVFAWLAREGARPWEVRHLLEPICREGRLPGMGTQGDYRRLAEGAGLAVTSFEDLSAQVRRTWSLCVRRLLAKLATRSDYRRFLLDGGARNRDFALSLARILAAYRTGSMRYGLMVAEKG